MAVRHFLYEVFFDYFNCAVDSRIIFRQIYNSIRQYFFRSLFFFYNMYFTVLQRFKTLQDGFILPKMIHFLKKACKRHSYAV